MSQDESASLPLPHGTSAGSAAKAIYNDVAYELLAVLTELAKRHKGLDRLQIFMSQDPSVEDLWVEQGHDAIVFHLPSEH
jgi:hypothetical protein